MTEEYSLNRFRKLIDEYHALLKIDFKTTKDECDLGVKKDEITDFLEANFYVKPTKLNPHVYSSKVFNLITSLYPLSDLTLSIYLNPEWEGYLHTWHLFEKYQIKDLPIDIFCILSKYDRIHRRIYFMKHSDNIFSIPPAVYFSNLNEGWLIKSIDCIHTALQTISFEDWRDIKDINDFVKEAHNKNQDVSNERARVDLCWEDDWFSLCSWAQGIAEAGVDALYLEGELEENLHSNSTSLVKTLREIYLKFMSMEQIIKHIQKVAKQCRFEGCYHLPSLISNIEPICEFVKGCNMDNHNQFVRFIERFTDQEREAFHQALEEIFSFATKLDFKFENPEVLMNAIMNALHMEKGPAFTYWKKIRELLGNGPKTIDDECNQFLKFASNYGLSPDQSSRPEVINLRTDRQSNPSWAAFEMINHTEGAVQGVTGTIWIDEIDYFLTSEEKAQILKKAKDIQEKHPNTKIIKSWGLRE
jgi:hypothetical protein